MRRSGPRASRSAAATSPMTICWSCWPCGVTTASVVQRQRRRSPMRKNPMSDDVVGAAREHLRHGCSFPPLKLLLPGTPWQ